MRYKILKDEKTVNEIVSSEKFVVDYCAKHGYTYEEEPVPDPPIAPATEPEPTPARLRENAYNTEKVIAWDGEKLTVTEASQKWQYYAAEGNTEKSSMLTALIAEAKETIRAKYPDVE